MLSFDDDLLVVDSNPACVTKHPVISAQTNCDCAPLVQVHNTQVLFTFTWKVIWQAPVMVCKNELFPVWLYVTVFYKKQFFLIWSCLYYLPVAWQQLPWKLGWWRCLCLGPIWQEKVPMWSMCMCLYPTLPTSLCQVEAHAYVLLLLIQSILRSSHVMYC